MFLDRLATMRSGPSSWQKGMDVLAETLNHLVGICGLTQLNSVAYGCVPLVSRTDGPTDTEIDANPAALAATVPTGFQMNAVSQDTLAMAVSRTVARSTDVRRNGSGFKPTEWGPISLGMRAGRLMLNCATN